MKKAFTLNLRGTQAAEVAQVLGARLVEAGAAVEQVNAQTAQHLGGTGAAAYLCRVLTRNGIFVINSIPGFDPESDARDFSLDPDDTTDFAAEKIIEILREDGVIAQAAAEYSPEEEEEIKRRLADLGYIE